MNLIEEIKIKLNTLKLLVNNKPECMVLIKSIEILLDALDK